MESISTVTNLKMSFNVFLLLAYSFVFYSLVFLSYYEFIMYYLNLSFFSLSVNTLSNTQAEYAQLKKKRCYER